MSADPKNTEPCQNDLLRFLTYLISLLYLVCGNSDIYEEQTTQFLLETLEFKSLMVICMCSALKLFFLQHKPE